MQTLKFDVHGMTCGGCTGSVQSAVSKITGVSHVDVTLRPGTATVQIDPTLVTPEQIESAITTLGYRTNAHATEPAAKTMP